MTSAISKRKMKHAILMDTICRKWSTTLSSLPQRTMNTRAIFVRVAIIPCTAATTD